MTAETGFGLKGKPKGFTIAALLLGVFALFGGPLPFVSIPLGVIGLLCARAAQKRDQAQAFWSTGRWFSWIGIAVGVATLLVVIVRDLLLA